MIAKISSLAMVSLQFGTLTNSGGGIRRQFRQAIYHQSSGPHIIVPRAAPATIPIATSPPS